MLNKELIFEDLSVSKIVNDTSVKIATDIINTFKETEEKYISVSFMVSFKARENTIDYSNEPLFGIVEKLDFTIYDFPNDKEYDDYVKFLNLASQYDTKEKTITINCISINNVIDMKMLHYMLNHEIHHVYQKSLYDMSTLKSKLYNTALIIMDDKYANSIQRDFANMVYYCNENEIDANMQSLYKEYQFTNGDNNRNNILIYYQQIKQMYDYYRKFEFDESLNNISKNTFGITIHKLLNYIGKRLNYFDIKSKKVYTKYIQKETKIKYNRLLFNRFVL